MENLETTVSLGTPISPIAIEGQQLARAGNGTIILIGVGAALLTAYAITGYVGRRLIGIKNRLADKWVSYISNMKAEDL